MTNEDINPWGATLAYIPWAIRDSYPCTIGTKKYQYLFCRYMVFKITSFIDSRCITTREQRQVNIGNIFENSKQVRFDCVVVNLVYVGMTVVYHKIYYLSFIYFLPVSLFPKRAHSWVVEF